mmetsp:Transcript_111874/g.280257  ORF Transcript_111874/g.280257 Transcript_111874/m.280257 type:complete len:343 (+) Transcript_111874:461-1489(+)
MELDNRVAKGVHLRDDLLRQLALLVHLVAADRAAVDQHHVRLVLGLDGIDEEVSERGLLGARVSVLGIEVILAAADLLPHLFLSLHLPLHHLAVDLLVEGIRVCQGQEPAVDRVHLAVIIQPQCHDPLSLQIGIRLDVGRMTTDRGHLGGVIVTTQDEVERVAQLLCHGTVIFRELVRQSQHDRAILLFAEVLRLLLRRLQDVVVRDALLILEHGLPDVIGGTEHADSCRLRLATPHGGEGYIFDQPLGGAREKLTILIHEIGVEPWKLRLLDPLLQLVHPEVELVISKRGRIQLEVVEDVDHLLTLEQVAEHRGRQQVARKHHEGAIGISRALLLDHVGGT